VTQGAHIVVGQEALIMLQKTMHEMIDGIIQTTDKNTNYSIYDDLWYKSMELVQLKGGIGFDKRFGLA